MRLWTTALELYSFPRTSFLFPISFPHQEISKISSHVFSWVRSVIACPIVDIRLPFFFSFFFTDFSEYCSLFLLLFLLLCSCSIRLSRLSSAAQRILSALQCSAGVNKSEQWQLLHRILGCFWTRWQGSPDEALD